MLILARNLGESIIIGDDVGVTVLSNQRGQIRLAINAPREVGA
ncbi:carbon storage regulator [Thiopseudomonas alkaliphila]|nr:carbon storage regulator [Thiopseudomonas alkaliphila]MDM1708246.1 carbon storage regulator [Thiopseudomonas alkaliphila]